MELGMSVGGPVGGGLPNSRIRCNGTRIQVGSRDFTSATEALQAYLDQYSGLTSRYSVPYKRDVSDLLDPKSILHMTADRSLQTGIRDTEIEMKLADTKTSVNNTYDRIEKSTKLRAEGYSLKEAEDALNRSGDLLYQLQTEDLGKPNCPSDVDSLSTDVLMTMNPTAGYSDRKHVYSYKRPKSQQKQQPLTNRSDSASDFFMRKPPSSFNTRTGSIPMRERSRSVSPSSNRQSEKLLKKPQKWIQDPNVTDTKPPSWIEALDITDPGESLWSRRDLRSGRAPPSWVNGLEGSDITSLASQPVNKVGVSELLGNNDSLYGMKYEDLMKSPRKTKRGKDKYDLTSQLPKEVMDSGKKLNSSDILEQYLDNASDKKSDSILDSLKGDNRVPRCSSLDTEALIAGMSAPLHNEIAGASPITGTPHRSRRPQSPDTDLVLESERPWEKQVAFKSPVYVDEDTSDSDMKAPTFTGRQQPGSLETLKNMLYKLQSEESSSSREKILAAQEELNMSNEELEDVLRDYNFDHEPGGKSLEKALSHLTKLKTLVKDGKALRSRSPSPHVRLQSRSPSPQHRYSSKSPSRISMT